jgi:hypothetical protein
MLRLSYLLTAIGIAVGQPTSPCPAGTYVYNYAPDGTPVCEPCNADIPECSTTSSTNGCPPTDPRCEHEESCTDIYCQEPSILLFNKYCVWDNTMTPIYKCNDGDIYNSAFNKCLSMYLKNSTDCKPGYTPEFYNNEEVCLYSYEPTTDCENGFMYLNLVDGIAPQLGTDEWTTRKYF